MIERLDVKAEYQTWQTIDLKMKTQNTAWICLEGCGLQSIDNDQILIFGGFTSSDQKSKDCFIFDPSTNEIEQIIAKTCTVSNFYQRQPKLGADGKLYCVETNTLDLHVFDVKK